MKDRFYRHMFAVLALVLSLLLVWQWRRPLLSAGGLLLTGITLAYLVHPLAALFERKMKRGLAALTVILVMFIIITVVLLVGVPAFGRQVRVLTDSIPQYLGAIRGFLRDMDAWLNDFGVEANLEPLLADAARLSSVVTSFTSNVMNIASAASSAVVRLFLLPVIIYYLLRDRETIFDNLAHMIPSKHRPVAIRAAKAVRSVLSGYVRGRLTVSLITGAITGIGFAIVGLDGYLVLGAVMAVFNLIPVFGPVIGAVPAIVVAAPMGITTLLITVLVVLLVQQLENAVISPKIIGESIQIHPVTIIIVLIAGGGIMGIFGMLFAVPVVLVIRVVYQAIRDAYLYSAEREPRVPGGVLGTEPETNTVPEAKDEE